MSLRTLAFLLAGLIGSSLAIAFPSPTAHAEPSSAYLTRFCVECHDGDSPSGGIRLEGPWDDNSIRSDARKWAKVIRAVKYHEMPPAESTAPNSQERQDLYRWLDRVLEVTRTQPDVDPGVATIRRLNKVELGRTLEDLLGVKGDLVHDLPSDPPAYGFDNIGGALFSSPELIEKYIELARIVGDKLVGDQKLLERIGWEKLLAGNADMEALVQPVLRRAFRRPPTPDEVKDRVSLFKQALESGVSPALATRTLVQSIVVSPNFLFRTETNREPVGSKKAYRLTDHELASRLSYFLWSTMPDDVTGRLADEHHLSEPAVFANEVKRLLDSPKAEALTKQFVGQWLRFREILTLGVDFRSFPAFNDTVRGDLYEEAVRFVDDVIRENRSALDLIDCNYTYANDRLARYYGLPGVEGSNWRKVTLPDRRRGGILGLGAILTVTSYPTRSSPVIRGKWILEEILNSPPPPPPPNVPSLVQTIDRSNPRSLRQRLELHRKQESCASCHRKMDPLGFALENYDGIGRWRDKEKEFPVDATGELPGDVKFEGPIGLKQLLLDRKEVFVRTMLERMMVYALGRPLESSDEGVIRRLLADLEKDQYRIRTMIMGVAQSYPFQFRRNADEEERHDR